MTPANTNSVATRESVSAPIQNGIDMSFRPRDEDPNIMPIPPRTGFKFDPRQLRDSVEAMEVAMAGSAAGVMKKGCWASCLTLERSMSDIVTGKCPRRGVIERLVLYIGLGMGGSIGHLGWIQLTRACMWYKHI
jgi:hypothetical protein